MVRVSHYITKIAILVAVCGSIGLILNVQSVAAEGDNDFPGVEDGAQWNFSNRSPDPGLMWLYKDRAPDETIRETTHILRNRDIGRNKGTRLRVYYRNQPDKVQVTINVIQCELDAPFANAGPVRVTLGGNNVYEVGTRAREKVDHYDKFKIYPNGGGERVNGSEGAVDSSDRFNQSPVCDNYPEYDVPIWVHREDCAPAQQQSGGRCGNNGTETYAVDKTGNGNYTVEAVKKKLDGKTFSVDFPRESRDWNNKIGYDSETNLYFADLDIELDARNDPALAEPGVMQRITFKVVADSATNINNGSSMRALMGYRKSVDEAQDSKYFGLQGNGGVDNDYPAYGAKFAIPFGMNCNDPRDTSNGKIILYDPDAAPSGFGTSYAIVYRRNPSNGNIIRLGQSEYDIGANASWNGNRIAITGGSNQDSAFRVKLDRGFQYMLVVSNPNHPGGGNSASNVWSLFLPENSINGLINCRYDLTPKITNVADSFSAYGATLNPKGEIDNSEDSTATGDHEWRITRAVFANPPSDMTRSGVVDSDLAPCNFMSGHKDCQRVYEGVYPADSSKPDLADPTGVQDVGTYICYITSVKNPTWAPADDNKWRHSRMMCSVGGVTPKLQVWGGDVKATGAIHTTVNDIQTSNRRYGSWGEYGVASNGRNSAMGSGAGLNSPSATYGSTQSSWSGLTFANTPTYGEFEGDLSIPPASRSGAIIRNSDRTISSIDDLIQQTMPAGNSLGSLVADGNARKTFVINGRLTISGNLTYPATVSNIRNIPRITIIASNGVVVNSGVSQIDTILETPRLSTCDSVRSGTNYFVALNTPNLLRSGVCGNPIRFNSPVNADKLYLYRTFDTADGQAAETFNLRADNILSSYAGGGPNNPVATTNSVIEIPPRF